MVLALISLIAVLLSLRVRDAPAPRQRIADKDDENINGLNAPLPLVDGSHNAVVELSPTLTVRANEIASSRPQSQRVANLREPASFCFPFRFGFWKN